MEELGFCFGNLYNCITCTLARFCLCFDFDFAHVLDKDALYGCMPVLMPEWRSPELSV